MKKLFFALVATIFSTTSFAQVQAGEFSMDQSTVYYGVRLGLNVANITGDGTTLSSKAGLNFGGVIGLRISETTPLFIESGLYYTQRGGKDGSYTADLNCLEIPILLKYGIKATDDIAVLPFIGPYFALGVGGQTEYSGIDGKEKESTYDHLLNRNDMGFKLGCGAEYNMIYVEVAYQFGLHNIAEDSDLSIHANQLSINLGVNF